MRFVRLFRTGSLPSYYLLHPRTALSGILISPMQQVPRNGALDTLSLILMRGNRHGGCLWKTDLMLMKFFRLLDILQPLMFKCPAKQHPTLQH